MKKILSILAVGIIFSLISSNAFAAVMRHWTEVYKEYRPIVSQNSTLPQEDLIANADEGRGISPDLLIKVADSIVPGASAEETSAPDVILVEDFETGLSPNPQGADLSVITTEQAHSGRYSLELVNSGKGLWASYGLRYPFENVPEGINFTQYDLSFYGKGKDKGIAVSFVDERGRYSSPDGREDFVLSDDWEQYKIDLNRTESKEVNVSNIIQLSLHHGDEAWWVPLSNSDSSAFIDDIMLVKNGTEISQSAQPTSEKKLTVEVSEVKITNSNEKVEKTWWGKRWWVAFKAYFGMS
ncbi:MAG: hypothetical protein KAS87_03845 [Candidatus Omnitrophica bacterium]|nr:hypothetical protein [Candidatus Omnitrophota bacterium]